MSPRDTKSLNSGNFSDDELYIALSNTNLDWLTQDVDEFIRLWNEEYTTEQIANFFKRPVFECFLLYCDLAEKRKIHPRKEGPWHETFKPYQERRSKIRITTDEPKAEQETAKSTIPHDLRSGT